MKYSIWTTYLQNLSPEEMVITFAGKGWYNLELSTEHAEQLLKRGNPLTTGAEFKKFADNYGVAFSQGHLWLQADIACEKQGETVAILKNWLDLFYAVGIKACVLHAGGREMMKKGYSDEQIDAARVKALTELCTYIADRDMFICLENLVRSHKNAAELRMLIDAVGLPNLAICLDTGHLNICGGSQSDFVRQSGELLKALHITDNEGKTDQHMMPYGKGNINWDELLDSLAAKDVKYNGLFNFEIPGENCAPINILLAKLDYLREIAEYMVGRAEGKI